VIFVTVGAQLPFDRLIRTVDDWAAKTKKEVFAQIGATNWRPQHIQYTNFLDPIEFQKKFSAAEIIIAHAGMGTIISALEAGKPILVMPRQAALGETRNDHQLATAKRFLALNYVDAAFDETELRHKLSNIDTLKQQHIRKQDTGPSPLLIQTIRDFINR